MLTEEQKLNLANLDFSTLTAEELDEAMILAGNMGALEAIPAANIVGSEPLPVEEPKEEPKPIEEPKPVEEPKHKDELARVKEEKWRAADEANRLKQENEKLKRDLEKQKLAELQPKTEIDPWDENFQRKNHERLNELEARSNRLMEREAELARQEQVNSILKEAEDIAKEFKLPLDVRSMDREFKEYGAKLGRAFTQEEWAKEHEDPKAVEAYFDLLGAFQTKAQGGYPKARAAFKDMDLDAKWANKAPAEPAWQAKVQQSEAEGHRATAKAASARTTTMPSSYSGESSELSADWATNWLAKNPNPAFWTKDDHATFATINKKFM